MNHACRRRWWGGIVCAALCVAITPTAAVHAQITANVLLRVLRIQAGPEGGTAFTLDIDGRQYLVTAKHVVAALQPVDTISIFREDQWRPLKVQIFRSRDPIDIAVLVPPTQITASYPLEPGIMFPGQDAYFLGFPYGRFFTVGKGLGTPYPVPFLKRGIISAMMDERDGAKVIYLDGHNNPGFSGGPVVFRDLSERSMTFRVLAVVSGYEPDPSIVLRMQEIQKKDITPDDEAKGRIAERRDGKVFRLNDTDQVIKGNSGIVKSYHIQHAIDLIRSNPIGPRILDK